MKLGEVAGVGIITKQNTTKDVKPGETKRQAKKLGLLHPTAAKNSDPNKLFNLGITEDADVLYHATYGAFVDSIMKNGLGGTGAQTQWEDSLPGHVYLARDPEVAESHAEANEEVPDEYIDDIVVFAIDTSKLDMDKLGDDPNVMDDNSTLAYKGVIPTSALMMAEGKRVPRKKGQKAGSKKHSDLYTDENPKGTIQGLKFATVKDAEASVRKIKSSGKKHAHKIQAAIAMEQRAKAAGKSSAAAVYRRYINAMKKKTKKMKETKEAPPGTYFTKSGNLVKGRLTKDAQERGARETDPKDNQRSKVPPITQYKETNVQELKIEKPDPKDTLGVLRKDMPQVKSDDYKEFIDYLQKNGAKFTKETIPARDLSAMQQEFSDAGILKQLTKNIELGPNRKAVIASSDDYIIDGHHRWLVALNTGADLNVFRVNIPAYKLYDLVNKFEKTYYKDLYDETRGSIGVPLSGGLVVKLFPHRPLRIKKSTPGKLKYEDVGLRHTLELGTYKHNEENITVRVNPDKSISFIQPQEYSIADDQDYLEYAQSLLADANNWTKVTNEAITTVDLDQLETFADKLFAKVGIDVEFTRHFLDRVNDTRNVKPITMAELTRLFKQEFKRYGKPIAQMGPGQEAVMKDLQTDINLPFALQYDKDNNELDLIAKTVMRKKDFKTPNREFPVEGWSAKYKKSINCSNPKGFSQKAHCAGKKKKTEEAPPGREKQVRKLKKKFDDPGAPYAIAWAQHNKHGKPTKEETETDKRIADLIGLGDRYKKKDPDEPSMYDKIKNKFKGYFDKDKVDEGVNDPHIFKAVFMAGGPGSGKGFVAKNILGGTGLRTVNSDDMFEYLMKQKDLALDPDVIATPQGQEVRQRAKTLIKSREQQYLDGRIGLIIDGTGKEPERIQQQVNKLREIGYDSAMILVNTSLPVAQQRNKDRERTVPPELVSDLWNKVQENLMKYQQIFGAGRFHIIDNSGGLEDLDRQENFDKVYVETQRFLNTPPSKKPALEWIQKQKEQNDGQRSANTQQQNQQSDGGTTTPN